MTPVAIAFGAGLLAAVNPCGFALLPSFLGRAHSLGWRRQQVEILGWALIGQRAHARPPQGTLAASRRPPRSQPLPRAPQSPRRAAPKPLLRVSARYDDLVPSESLHSIPR